jgi:hypothetical protein
VTAGSFGFGPRRGGRLRERIHGGSQESRRRQPTRELEMKRRISRAARSIGCVWHRVVAPGNLN